MRQATGGCIVTWHQYVQKVEYSGTESELLMRGLENRIDFYQKRWSRELERYTRSIPHY